MARLIDEGKVRSDSRRLVSRRSAAPTPLIRSRAQRVFACERNLEPRLIPLLRELGIGLVPFAPLGRGFLAGELKRAEEYPADDFRRNDPRYQGANFDANVRAAAVVREIAEREGVTPGQVSLAWLLSKGPDIVPIPGTKRRRYLEENVAAAVSLRARPGARTRAGPAGPRYGEKLMAQVDR
jgi:aryl-alcohol dehydrogenase-like predicted oxidoreductase